MSAPAKPPPDAEQILSNLAATDPYAAGYIVGAMWSALTPKQRAAVWQGTETPRTRDIDDNPRDATALWEEAKLRLEQWRSDRRAAEDAISAARETCK